MNMRTPMLLLLGVVIAAPANLSAQPGYMRKGYSSTKSSGEQKARPAKKRRRKRKRKDVDHGAPAKSGTDKASIESYLQTRLKELKKTNRSQGVFGRRMKIGWDKFWTQVYEDRKQFEIRMAKQRLNLFESLASLDNSFHARTIADFERLQDTQVKSFESNLKAKMADYTTTISNDLRTYGVEQEQARAEFMTAAMEAWSNQKAATLSAAE
jgi:hypothetical protein